MTNIQKVINKMYKIMQELEVELSFMTLQDQEKQVLLDKANELLKKDKNQPCHFLKVIRSVVDAEIIVHSKVKWDSKRDNDICLKILNRISEEISCQE